MGLSVLGHAACPPLRALAALFPPPAVLFSRTRRCLSSAERPLPPTLNENPCVSLRLGTGALRPPYWPFFLVLLLAVRCALSYLDISVCMTVSVMKRQRHASLFQLICRRLHWVFVRGLSPVP